VLNTFWITLSGSKLVESNDQTIRTGGHLTVVQPTQKHLGGVH